MALDAYDKKLLELLKQDSRAPISELAKQLRISRDRVAYKLKQHEGTLFAYQLNVPLSQMGWRAFHVYFDTYEVGEAYEKFLQKLSTHENTRAVYEYSDHYDTEWVFIARNLLEAQNILAMICTEFSAIIHTATTVEAFPEMGSVNLDEKDLDIINALDRDARLSSYKIGDECDLSGNAVRHRLKQLPLTFTIRKNKQGTFWNAVLLSQKKPLRQSTLSSYLNGEPIVVESEQLFGVWDLVIYTQTNSIEAFHTFIKTLQKSFGDNLLRYETLTGYKEHAFYSVPKVIFSNAT